jgi:hypothetical protein
VAAAGKGAARSLLWSSGVLGALLLVLFAARFRTILVYGVLVLCLCELFLFARTTRATMDPSAVRELPTAWRGHLPPANQRLLAIPTRFANLGMSLGYSNLNGYDPGVLRTYAELIHATQGANPDEATQYLPFRRPLSGIFRMLRCAAVFFDGGAAPLPIADPLPEATVVGYWVVLPSRDAQFAYLMRNDFDPRFAVVLESEPAIPAGAASAAGARVEVLSSTTDTLEVRAHVAHPAILLITNNFARGWRVRSLQSTASQQEYRLIPANYTLQAIPLMPGSHHLMLEYAPRAFAIGRWISIAAAVLFAGIGLRQSLRRIVNFLLMRARARFR